MTWKEIKEAVEEAGLEDNEEISLIKCENGDVLRVSVVVSFLSTFQHGDTENTEASRRNQIS